MMDAILVATIVAAGTVGWSLCLLNTRVFGLWRLLAFPAMFVLTIYLVVVLAMARPEWWTDIEMDRPMLLLSLWPVLAWPMRKERGRLAEASV
jgi:hypothetical protein